MTEYRVSDEGNTALDEIEGQGFALPDKPKGVGPTLPEDLSDLDDGALTMLMVELTAWADFAQAQLGLSVIEERQAERTLDLAQGEYWREQLAADPKTQVTVLRMVALTDDVVLEARESVDSAYAYRRLISDLAERYERDAAVLSRELTRRTSVEKPSRRFGI